MSTSTVSDAISAALPLFAAPATQAAGAIGDDRALFPAGDSAEVAALVSAAQAGDQDAFGALVARHERVVYRTALAALGSPADAEDAAQDAFVMAWRRLGAFRGDSTFKTWLLTIVWRKALDRRRARAAWWSRLAAGPRRDDGWSEAASALDQVPADVPTPERAALSRDLVAQARREIVKLSPKLRDALLLASSGEHRYDEIAVMLGIPVGTVKWRVAEARRRLTARVGGTA
jgi:RNA polymerase sigma-70 factor (ECF subfamily)